MDPNETLRIIAEALDDGDYAEAREFAINLEDWLHKGGFAPNWKAYPRAELYCLRLERNSR